MGGYTESCREIANYLGLKANMIFIDYPRRCSSENYDRARNKFPAAYFIEVGNCNDGNTISTSTQEIESAILTAEKYALNNAYFLFSIHDPRKFDEQTSIDFTDIVQYLNRKHFRPTLLTLYPLGFMEKTQLYYDEIILISHSESSMGYYGTILEKVDSELIENTNHNSSCFDINARLGNGPLIAQPPVLFSKSTNSIFDTIAIAGLAYGIYKLARHRYKNNKLKKR